MSAELSTLNITHKYVLTGKTAFNAVVKSGQIIFWTSQEKEENDLKGSKGQFFVLRFVEFDPFYFCFLILQLWLWWQGLNSYQNE